MRFIFGLFIVFLLVIILDYSDFFLTRYVRNRIGEINDHSMRLFGYKPITGRSIVIISLIFWIPPLYLPGDKLLLEYRILITLLYWIVVSICHASYLGKKSSKKISRQALPFLISFALAGGLLLGPLITAINALLGIS